MPTLKQMHRLIAERDALRADLAAATQRAKAAEAALADVPVEAICKLRKYLSDDDDYSICREDGEKLSIGEIILFGDLFEAIDKWLDSQPEVQP